jgi:hypothetical protein
MTEKEIDFMWQIALQDAIKNGEEFTRHRFAEMVAAKERDECAKICDAQVEKLLLHDHQAICKSLASDIRARCGD